MPIPNSLLHKLATFSLFKRPIYLIVHRANGAHTSTQEPLDLELERIMRIEQEDTRLDLPAIQPVDGVTTVEIAHARPAYYPQEEQEDLDKTLVRMPAIAKAAPQTTDEAFLLDQKPPINLYERRVALFDDHVEAYNEPIARIVSETIPVMNTVITFRDRANNLTLDELCRKAVLKHQKSVGVLPTHIVVNSMRLISEHRAAAWETYNFYTQGGLIVPIKLRGMSKCGYNVARAVIEDEGRVKVA